ARGSLEVAGRRVPLGRPGAIRRAGLARTFQSPQTFRELTCIENVLLADRDRHATGLAGAWLGRRAMWRRERRRWARALAALDGVGLPGGAEEPAGMLPYGQQRMLGLARARAGEPAVLVADEPSAGLDDTETAELARLLGDLPARGVSLLVVDHKLDLGEQGAGRGGVLQLGRGAAAGPPAEGGRR